MDLRGGSLETGVKTDSGLRGDLVGQDYCDRRRVNKAAFAQTKLMHQATNVVLIITDSKHTVDGIGQFGCGPAVRGETVGTSTFLVHAAD